MSVSSGEGFAVSINNVKVTDGCIHHIHDIVQGQKVL